MNLELVLVGWLCTHEDGFEVRMGKDLDRAQIYARTNRAVCEAMFVRRAFPARRADEGDAKAADRQYEIHTDSGPPRVAKERRR